MTKTTHNTQATVAARFLDEMAAWDANGIEPVSSRVSLQASRRLDAAAIAFLSSIPGVSEVFAVGDSGGSKYYELVRADGAYVTVRVSNHQATGSQRSQTAWSFEVADSVQSIINGIEAVELALANDEANA